MRYKHMVILEVLPAFSLLAVCVKGEEVLAVDGNASETTSVAMAYHFFLLPIHAFGLRAASILHWYTRILADILLLSGVLRAKTSSDYEARRSGGLRINVDHLGFFNVHYNASTRAFLHFASIEMRPPRPGSIPRSRAQQRNALAD